MEKRRLQGERERERVFTTETMKKERYSVYSSDLWIKRDV